MKMNKRPAFENLPAAVVVPQYINATDDASTGATRHELQKLRRSIDMYRAKNAGTLPNVQAGDGTWGELATNEYLGDPPENRWVGTGASSVITLGDMPDASYQTNHGWIFDPATGEVWAGSFDADDQPLARP